MLHEFGPGWHRSTGAVEWLAKITSTLPSKQRKYPACQSLTPLACSFEQIVW